MIWPLVQIRMGFFDSGALVRHQEEFAVGKPSGRFLAQYKLLQRTRIHPEVLLSFRNRL
jgi:hypothetical protein